MRRMTIAAWLAVLLVAGWPARSAAGATCPGQERVRVPGAERQQAACLVDLTTAGTQKTGHTDRTDWSGLHATGTRNPSKVPGLQVDGYFDDTSGTNASHGWFHDAQFVIRFPSEWNGKLVVTGAPGVRRQYSSDFIIGDWVLAKGYAFASTDKGNTGVNFQDDGVKPGDAVAEWHARVTELTRAAKGAVTQNYGRPPARTYMTGISNGGYLTRMALETHPELYDGGVDWEGTLFIPEGPNLFTYLPPALRNYAAWKRGGKPAHKAILKAGFEPGSEFLWDDHMVNYWDLTQRIYREEFDPGFDGPLNGGIPFCQAGMPYCDADYSYADRPKEVKEAVARVSLTGRIGKPMLTLHGTLDSLLPIRTDSDVYARMVDAAGAGAMHRYYVFEAGNHVDGRYDRHPDRIRPLLPCYRAAFEALERWVEQEAAPPPSQFVAKPTEGDIVNECDFARGSSPRPPGPLQGGPPGSEGDRRPDPQALEVRVAPRRGSSLRHRFGARGRLLLPERVTREQGCKGRVSVRVEVGGETISTRRTAVRRDCRFASRVASRGHRRLGRRGKLELTVRFLGNDVLKPLAARPRRVLAG